MTARDWTRELTTAQSKVATCLTACFEQYAIVLQVRHRAKLAQNEANTQQSRELGYQLGLESLKLAGLEDKHQQAQHDLWQLESEHRQEQAVTSLFGGQLT